MSVAPVVVPDLADDAVRLRPPTAADVPLIALLCRDPEIQRWTRVPSPYTEDDARTFVATSERALADGDGVHLAIVEIATGDILGAVGLDIDRRDFSGELGYWLAPTARGRGVATRATRLLVDFAFGHLDLGYIRLQAAVDNAPSNAVARRLGFTLEGTSRDAMLIGPTGDPTAARGDAHLWGLRPGELLPRAPR